ncbi:histidine--tRNA ligase [Nakamurella leprariae]|uniref:Histidine--tRNA ligase n=1 Tax=Nakamurella leprariae TaxID=2803911 RepID=A0A939C1C7_9ACTN|nr:histidine--tRNA ligase [Nakamurella leprariae]MBM9467022.1 histidine--tRNA ligase [Nakamurella leprariae]
MNQQVPFGAPKGVPDYVPPVSRQFAAVRGTLVAAADRAGYAPIELPVFEDTGLFARGVGESTDVVSKEMYTFADRGGRSVTLRPEGTAGVMRAVIEHRLDRGPLPIKVVYAGPFFRYERPQAGRYRQLQQVGIEAIGSDDPALDAEVIAVADEAFRAVGLSGYRLELTSLGDAASRPAYRERLQAFLADLPLDEPTRERARINPLRVLDDKRPHVQELLADAPLLLDHLSPESDDHFREVRAILDRLGVQYVLNPRMVRGLDYYTRTTFEFVHPQLGAQSGLGGGGRYDGLMAELGGAALSGIGFGIGVDRTLLAAQAEGVTVGDPSRAQVFGVPIGAGSTPVVAVLAGRLREAGIRTDLAYGGRSLKSAMKQADASGAVVALVVGDRELAENNVVVRDLGSGEQWTVPADEVVAAVTALLVD